MQNVYLYGKRTISRIIDILIPSIALMIGGLLYINSMNKSFNQLNVDMLIFIFLFFYVIYIIVSILHLKNMTYGDFILKIKPISLKDEDIKIAKLLVREFYIAFLIICPFIYNLGWLVFILHFIPIGWVTEKKLAIIPLDLIFNIAYE